MTAAVTVRHNMETGHRLPHLAGKCENLHGHSWWCEVTVAAPNDPATVVEFGAFKAELRAWIDEHLDHGLMLGRDDPLAHLLDSYGKVYVFDPDDPHGITRGLAYPTVENTARLIARVAHRALESLARAPGSHIAGVTVTETHVNAATWTPEAEGDTP